MKKHGPSFVVECRQSDRPLTEEELQKLIVFFHRGTNANWNWEVLGNWGMELELLEWGFTEHELGLDAPDIDYDKEWEGMPEFEQEDLMPFQTVKVHFLTKEDRITFSDLVQQNITPKTKSLWYPEQHDDKTSHLVWKSES